MPILPAQVQLGEQENESQQKIVHDLIMYVEYIKVLLKCSVNRQAETSCGIIV